MTEQVIFTNPTHERTVAEYITYSHKEAGFWMRFWAFLIDTLIVSSIIGICVNPIFYLFDWQLNSTDWYAPIVIISGVIYYGYFVLMTKFFAQTAGKMIFGLKVVTDSGEKLDWATVLFREGVGRFLSNAFMKLPYLIVIFTPQHKALHDFTADTFVIHEETFKESRQKRYLQQQATEAPQPTAEVVAPVVALEKQTTDEAVVAPDVNVQADAVEKVESEEVPQVKEEVTEIEQQKHDEQK